MDNNKISREIVQRFSDKLFENLTPENGGRAFFDGFPRKTKKEFFADVKFFLGNHIGIYIWDYEYEEATK